MIRTQIYLKERQVGELKALSERSGMKKSELIREALDAFLEAESRGRREFVLRKTAGIWKDRSDLPDFSRARDGWQRGGS
jgi:metal-responsive CopG/Arc/MetJ family transcriptional regulator